MPFTPEDTRVWLEEKRCLSHQGESTSDECCVCEEKNNYSATHGHLLQMRGSFGGLNLTNPAESSCAKFFWPAKRGRALLGSPCALF